MHCREMIDTGKQWCNWVHIKSDIKVQYIFTINAHTPSTQDYHQSLTPSYPLKLCSFPRLTAANANWCNHPNKQILWSRNKNRNLISPFWSPQDLTIPNKNTNHSFNQTTTTRTSLVVPLHANKSWFRSIISPYKWFSDSWIGAFRFLNKPVNNEQPKCTYTSLSLSPPPPRGVFIAKFS